MHDRAVKAGRGEGNGFACYLTRNDLVALFVLLFVIVFGLVDLGRRHLGGVLGAMIPSAKAKPAEGDRLMAALQAALAKPIPAGVGAAGLFDGPAPVTLRGKTVFVEGAPRGVRVVIGNEDLFERASAVLHEEGTRLLDELAAYVRAYPNRLEIAAYVDDREVPKDAGRLSWKRVQAVVDYLQSRRIDRSRFLPGAAGTVPSEVRTEYPAGRIEIVVESPLP